mgnify:CR=1 FL=1
MKISEIRELTTAELTERIQTEKANYAQMKFNHAVSPMQNTSEIKKLRRDIARMMSELRDREINNK